MKLLRRLPLVLFSSFLLLVAAAIAADPYFMFGTPGLPGARKVGFERVAPPALQVQILEENLGPRGRNVLQRATDLSKTGGGMMVNTAKPDRSLVGQRVTLRYDATRPDGDRIEVTAGTDKAHFNLYDWELKPLATFVDSGNHGSVSIQLGLGREEVSLDAAFRNRLLGLRFIQADCMARNIILSQEYLPRNENGLLLGAGEKDRLGMDRSVARAVNDLAPFMAKTRRVPYSVLTDAAEKFTFSVEDGKLTVKGTPYYYYWAQGPGDTVVPREALNREVKKLWPKLRQANPVVIGAMERSFRAAALFRYESAKEKENWKDFMAKVRKIDLPRVPTPDFLSSN